MYYVCLSGETVERAKARYIKSGIICPSSNKQSAHQAAQFLFPVGANYQVLTMAGTRIDYGCVGWSYWESIMKHPIPEWDKVSAKDRKILYV